MCEFCEEHWNKKNSGYEVKDLSERSESEYNYEYYTGIQTYIDSDASELVVIACLDNEYIKPILKTENIKINYCPMCGRKLSEVSANEQ